MDDATWELFSFGFRGEREKKKKRFSRLRLMHGRCGVLVTEGRGAPSDDATGLQELTLPDPLRVQPECLCDPLKQEVDPLAAVGGARVWPALTPPSGFFKNVCTQDLLVNFTYIFPSCFILTFTLHTSGLWVRGRFNGGDWLTPSTCFIHISDERPLGSLALAEQHI